MENGKIMEMRDEILNHVRRTVAEVQSYVETFAEYKYIWTTDKQTCLQYFAKCGRVLMQTNDSASSLNTFKKKVRGVIRNRPPKEHETDEEKPSESKPTLNMFKDQVR